MGIVPPEPSHQSHIAFLTSDTAPSHQQSILGTKQQDMRTVLSKAVSYVHGTHAQVCRWVETAWKSICTDVIQTAFWKCLGDHVCDSGIGELSFLEGSGGELMT